MNFLNNIFGRTKVTLSYQKVIQNMRETIIVLEKREAHLDKIIESLKQETRLFVLTNKTKALMLLKKVKIYEKQLLSIYGQKENIETQIFAIEQGITNQNTIVCMKQGKNTIDEMTMNINPDDVGELVDDISSSMDTANEISNALSVPIGQIYDEDDLLEEFQKEQEQEYVKESSIQLDSPILHKENKTEDEELEELVAMM
jgi:charged multivesicular body protein 4